MDVMTSHWVAFLSGIASGNIFIMISMFINSYNFNVISLLLPLSLQKDEQFQLETNSIFNNIVALFSPLWLHCFQLNNIINSSLTLRTIVEGGI